MSRTLKEALHAALDARIRGLEQALIRGLGIDDYVKYRETVKTAEGLRIAKLEVDDVFRKYAAQDGVDDEMEIAD